MANVFDTPITTNDQGLDRVLAAGLPVAIVFLPEGSAGVLDQPMKRFARELAGQALIVRVPTRENPASVKRFSIEQAPAVVTYREGKVQSQAGGITGPDLEQHVNFLLGKGPKPAPKAHPHQQQKSNGSSAQPSGNSATASHPVAVSDSSFEREVMGASEPVLVDFWAPWCGPCRMIEPMVEKLARENGGRLKVVKLNVDENPGTAQRFNVQGIPTMMIVQNGKVMDQWTGALPEPALRSRVMRVLNAG